jgi:predicted ABC-type ATPase
MTSPQFLVIGGANGSGKSTSAPAVLPAAIPYINADEIAKTLTEESGATRDFRAGRLLLAEWNRLEASQEDFAIETTLASRTLAVRITRLQSAGYQFHLMFFWLSSADLAVQRVAERVLRGGHSIAEETIRRRYESGLRYFWNVYSPMANTWRVYDN